MSHHSTVTVAITMTATSYKESHFQTHQQSLVNFIYSLWWLKNTILALSVL